MLVVDASVVLNACLSVSGFEPLGMERLVAPPLLWSEASSALHELQWRRSISTELVGTARERLRSGRVEVRRHSGLIDEAWRVADELGWAKTYDAEYVALARLLRCRLLTVDERLRRTAARVVDVIGPTEL